MKLARAAASVEERTPEDRDRFADLVRVVAILVVVLGHWIVAVVQVDDGAVTVGQLLTIEPWTQYATWLVQVMPLFFLVGGKVNAGSLSRARASEVPATAWVRKRSQRLLRPLVPLLAVWVVLSLVLELSGVDAGLVEIAVEMALLPLWFLVVYLLVIVLAPVTLWLHRRAPALALGVAVAGVIAVDLADRADVAFVGELNYLLVFGIAHQLGYFWFDDRLPGGNRALALGAFGLTLAIALVAVADYPLSMVGLLAGGASNATPPNLALLGLAIAQLGVVLALEGAGNRMMHARRVLWASIVVSGSAIITVFVWHMSAMVVVASVTHLAGWWPVTGVADLGWWAMRPVWLALCALTLVPFVLVFRRFEGSGRPSARPASTILGLITVAAGLYLVLTEGPWRFSEPIGAPLAGLTLIAIGFPLLGLLRSGRAAERAGSEDE